MITMATVEMNTRTSSDWPQMRLNLIFSLHLFRYLCFPFIWWCIFDIYGLFILKSHTSHKILIDIYCYIGSIHSMIGFYHFWSAYSEFLLAIACACADFTRRRCEKKKPNTHKLNSIPFPCDFSTQYTKYDLSPFVICANDAQVVPTTINFRSIFSTHIHSINDTFASSPWGMKIFSFQIWKFWAKYLNIKCTWKLALFLRTALV